MKYPISNLSQIRKLFHSIYHSKLLECTKEFKGIVNSRLNEYEGFTKREIAKLLRAKSDLQLEVELCKQKLKQEDTQIETINKVIEKSAYITSCLVEQSYIESLLDISAEENKEKDSKIRYRDNFYNRSSLVKLKIKYVE